MPQEKGLRGMPTKKEGSLPDSFQVNRVHMIQSNLKTLNQKCARDEPFYMIDQHKDHSGKHQHSGRYLLEISMRERIFCVFWHTIIK